MSKSVDERVVEMRFNNKQFEEGINESIKSLENLKKSLKMEDASKGLKGVEETGKKFSLSTVQNALEAVTSKFSVLGTFGDQIIRNLANKFTELTSQATAFVKSMSVDQISAGWQKYESSATSIRTIMNATGMTIEQIEPIMDKLLWFSDETSYSYDEMASSVAKFVNAGAGLEDAVDYTMGIANWASSAGQGYQQVQMALYNTTQAFSKGDFQLMDWRSIQNANMNTQEFQKTVIQTAEEMGWLKKVGEDTWETMGGNTVDSMNFADALSEGWFSKDVLAAVLKKYNDFTETVYDSREDYANAAEAIEDLAGKNMSLGAKALLASTEYRTLTDALNATKDAVSTGWMSSFKIIFGNIEEAKELWTKVGNALWDIFASGAERRNEFLRSLKDQGAFTTLFQAFGNIKDGFLKLVETARYAWNKIFPSSNGKTIVDLINKFSTFTEKFKNWANSLKTMTNIQPIVRGIGSAFQIVGKILKTLMFPFKSLNEGLKESGTGVLDLIAKFFSLFEKLNQSEKFTNGLTTFGNALSTIVKTVASIIGHLITGVKNLKSYLAPLGGFFARVWESIKSTFQSVIDFFKPTADAVESSVDKVNRSIDNIGGKNGEKAQKVKKKVDDLKESVSPLAKIFEVIVGFGKMVKSIIDAVSPLILATFQKITELVNATVEALTKMSKKITFEDILAGGLSAGITKFLWSFADFIKNLKGYISQIKEVLGSISEGISSFSKTMEKEANAVLIKSIAKAVLILAVAVFILAKIDPKMLLEATGAIVIMLAELTGSSSMLSKDKKKTMLDPKQILKMGTLLKKLATAILILAIALKIISDIDPKQMAAGVAAIAGLMLELTIAAKSLSKSVGDKKTAVNMAAAGLGLNFIASSIKTLARAIVILAQVSVDKIAIGVATIGALLAELAGFAKIVNGSKGLGKAGFAMLEVAAAVAVLSLCIKQLGSLDIPTLVKGLAAIGIAIGGLAGALRLIPKDVVGKAGALLILSAAIEVIALVVKQFGNMDIPNLIKGLAALGVAIVGIAAALRLMPESGVLKDGGAFLMIALAIEMLVPALKIIGNMSWEAIAKGVVALGAVVAGIAGALRLMGGNGGANVKNASAFIIIAAALNVMSIALIALSKIPIVGLVAGLSAVAVALGLMVAVSYAVKPVTKDLQVFAVAMIELGAAAVLFSAGLLLAAIAIQKIAEVGPSAFHVFLDGIAAVLMELPTLLTTLADSLAKAIPAIVSIVTTLITGLVQIVIQNIPSIVKVIGTLVMAFLTVIKDNIPVMVETILTLIVQVLTSIADHVPEIVTQIFRILVAIFDGLKTYIPVIVEDVAIMLRGVIDAVLAALEGLSVGDFAKALLGIGAMTAVFTALVAMAVVGLAASALLIPTANNMNKFIDAIDPFLTKIQQVDSQSLFGAEALANTIMTITKASILDAITGWFRGGGDAMTKFGAQIAQLGPYISQYAASIEGIDADAVLKSALAAEALARFADNLPKQGGWVQKIIGETDLKGFVEELVKLGPNLMTYANSVKGLDSEAVTHSIEAASVISEFAAHLPRHGGWAQAIIGDNSLNQFAQDLTVFGPNLMEYAKSVDGLPADVIETSIRSATAISEFAAHIPNQGGLWAALAGDNTLSKFGEELAAFGPYMADYATSVDGISAEKVEASGNAAAALTLAAQNLPRSGGIWGALAGNKDIQKFGEGLKTFGDAMAQYSEAVDGTVNVEAIETSATAAESMFKVAKLIPNQGGLWSKIAGDNTLGQFAEGLVPFGKAMKDYATSVTDLNTTDIVRSSIAAKYLFEMANLIPNEGGFISKIVGDNTLGDFAFGLKPFGKALQDYGESVQNLPVDSILLANDAMKGLFEVAASIPNQGGMLSKFLGDNTLSTMGKELEEFGPSFASFAKKMSKVGTAGMLGVTMAFTSLKLLGENLNSIPNQGGMKSWFQGDNTLGKIGEDLAVFGPSYYKFAMKIAEVPINGLVAIRMAFSSLSLLGEVLDGIPNQGGFKSWFQGDNTLGKIGEDLEIFGPAYYRFASKIAEVPSNGLVAVEGAFKSLIYLADALNAMPDQSLFDSWFKDSNPFAGVAEGLESLGPALSTFSDDLADFKVLPVMQAFGAVTKLGEALDSLPKQDGWLQKIFGETGSLSAIGKELVLFGPSLKLFGIAVTDLNTPAIEAAFNTIKVMAENLEAMPKEDGWVQKIVGETSLVAVGEGLEKFGPALAQFGRDVTDMNLSGIEEAFGTIKVMAESLDGMSPQGGLLQWFYGEKSLALIADDLVAFGPALRDYALTIKGINTGQVKNSFKATKVLIDSLDGIPNKGGLAEWFGVEKGLPVLTETLPQYGEALYKFNIPITHIDFDRMTEGVTFTESMVNILDGLKGKRIGFAEWFTGNTSLSTLGKDLASYGEYLAKFQENVKDVKYERIRGTVNTTETIVEIVNAMEPLGGWDGFWNGEKSLSTLGSQFADLGGYFATYESETSGIDWDRMLKSVDVLNQLVELGKGMQGVDFGGFYNFAESFNSLALSGTDQFITSWESGYEDIIKVGESTISNLLTGMSTKKNEAGAMATTIITTVKNNLNGPNVLHEPYSIGANYIQGLIDGMNSKVQTLNERTSWISRKQTDIMRQVFDEHSPSRVTQEIGEYLIEGLANGIVDGSSVANKASTDVSNEVLLAMTNAIASVMALMESDGDFAPVIRPVIDLSDAKSQAGKVGDLFGNQTIAATGFSAAAGLNRTIQNGGLMGGINNNTTNNSAAITINVYGGRGQNAQDIADEVQKRLKMDLDRRGYAFR